MRGYIITSGAIFGVGALIHVFRLIFGWPILVADLVVPIWVSWVSLIVTSLFAVWAVLSFRRTNGDIIRFDP